MMDISNFNFNASADNDDHRQSGEPDNYTLAGGITQNPDDETDRFWSGNEDLLVD